jgi:hypothetical protein
MPSFIVSNKSGGDQFVSGWPWSGQRASPVGGVQMVWDANASGNCYVGLSGGMTVQSGGFWQSGQSGMMDGVQITPGNSYFIPRLGTGFSGVLNLFASCDATASGQGRLYFEIFSSPWWSLVPLGLAALLEASKLLA